MFSRNFFYLFAFLLIFVALPVEIARAQTDVIRWHKPVNISQSANTNSLDPFLLADPSGIAHLFWAEKIEDSVGNQPDTLMYSSWDGNNWSQPIDLFFAPLSHGNLQVHSPKAVLDSKGIIHLIWIMQPNAPDFTLYYSSAPASQAGSASSWQPPVVLASDLTGGEFPIDISIDAHQNLHVIYARVPQGDAPPENRAVSYIRSTDGGKTWSDPVDLYTVQEIQNGASNTRLLVENPGRVYATWTEWGPDGNGQAIYFARSIDNGQTWEEPIVLTKRIGNEYERDWANMALLGENQLVVFWEGGWRAYRQAMYSYDGGITWSEPIDTFPWLIGETGFAEFARDSLDRLHVFVVQRVREGSVGRSNQSGLWYSVWESGTRWSGPTLAGNYQGGMLYPKVVILGGNRVLATWTSSTDDGDIMAMTGLLADAPPEMPSHPWPTNIPERSMPTNTPIKVTLTPNLPFSQTLSTLEPLSTSASTLTNSSMGIYSGVLSSLLIISIVFLFNRRKR